MLHSRGTNLEEKLHGGHVVGGYTTPGVALQFASRDMAPQYFLGKSPPPPPPSPTTISHHHLPPPSPTTLTPSGGGGGEEGVFAHSYDDKPYSQQSKIYAGWATLAVVMW